ncbi:hypothetical protein DL765_009234 [Monosporascus sp. GIB2]|nr:hypothetical protein DL765_009234 [Monosporascus sp. GIB2]
MQSSSVQSPQGNEQNNMSSDESIPYKAPITNQFLRDEDPSSIIEGEYLVNLEPRYTLEQHAEAIGRDLKPHIRHVFEPLVARNGTEYGYAYSTHKIDDELIELIRSDRRVMSVTCNAWGVMD